MRTTEDILSPPGEGDVARALMLFAASVGAAYGERLAGLFLFGSRARGDFEPFSDADVAVVLNDQDWALVRETRRLARLAHEVLIETGVEVQAWPVSRAAWEDPARRSESALVQSMRRDAKAIGVGRASCKAPPPTPPPGGEGSCIPPPRGEGGQRVSAGRVRSRLMPGSRITGETRSRAKALRRDLTIPEQRLWKHLKPLKAHGFHFRRQAPIGVYVADFVGLSAKFVVEVDGHLHGSPEAAAYDARRDAYLRREGFRVLRVGNGEVVRNVEGVVETVMRELGIDVE